ncbi:putative 2OG-Fe(II) oxygenase [Brevundimonas sp.]|uniref:putative 2OG-Fe(II) oxygenase n=1 Tax=Brevundimonas sp. TaxID=1871086 RepID=UPI0035B29977
MTTTAAVLLQAQALAGAGRLPEAVALLKRIGRLDVALDLRRAEVAQRSTSAVAEHNLAALLGDMGQAAEAEAAVRRAFAKGGDAPETWLVLARALLAQDRFDEADAAYRQALTRRPVYAEAVRDLAQLIWMRSGDAQAALHPFEAALTAAPNAIDLRIARATMMEYAGATPDAVLAALNADGTHPEIELAATHAALGVDHDRALAHARAAHALRPHIRTALKLAEVHLARTEPDAAMPLIEAVLRALPEDQNALSLQAVAWRLAGDPRATELYDYDTMVGAWTIDTPAPWTSLPAYLADLAAALRRLHGLTTHPLGQSLRHGTQTTASLLTSTDPAIRAFFTAIDGPIRRHIAGLGTGADPLRRRSTGAYRLSGAWSVQLKPGGYHAAHIHPEGWLSSACYIDLPDAVQAEGRQGWIGFGGAPFTPDLPHQHFKKPEPGKLVLFPSYMWHGTAPFEGDQTRLTIAFDVVPA